MPGSIPSSSVFDFLHVGDEAAVEAVACALDVGEKRRDIPPVQLSAVATVISGVAQPVHQPLGLPIEIVGKCRRERFRQPRSPFFGGVAAGAGRLDVAAALRR